MDECREGSFVVYKGGILWGAYDSREEAIAEMEEIRKLDDDEIMMVHEEEHHG